MEDTDDVDYFMENHHLSPHHTAEEDPDVITYKAETTLADLDTLEQAVDALEKDFGDLTTPVQKVCYRANCLLHTPSLMDALAARSL